MYCKQALQIVEKGGVKMNNEQIAKKLIELRGSKTQKEVSEAIGVSQAAYAMYETGQRVPRDSIKIKIASYYKKSIQSIFYAKEYN